VREFVHPWLAGHGIARRIDIRAAVIRWRSGDEYLPREQKTPEIIAHLAAQSW
jgi:hypothetical protein